MVARTVLAISLAIALVAVAAPVLGSGFVSSGDVKQFSTGGVVTDDPPLPDWHNMTCDKPTTATDYVARLCGDTLFVTATEISTSAVGFTGDIDKSLVLRGTEITVDASFKAPGHSIWIIGETVTLGEDVVIDVSGVDGWTCGKNCSAPDPPTAYGVDGTPGRDGGAGQDGGNVILVAETFHGSSAKPLVIHANGGKGGSGQPGGDGSIGVKGDDAHSCDHPGKTGGPGGNGGKPGSNGNGGNGGVVNVYGPDDVRKSFTVTVTYGPGTTHVAAGGRPGDGGVGGAGYSKTWKKHWWGGHGHCSAAAGARGPAGHAGGLPRTLGNRGVLGTFDVLPVNSSSFFDGYSTLQLQFALDEAEGLYRNQRFDEAKDHLQWIVHVGDHKNHTESVPEVTHPLVGPVFRKLYGRHLDGAGDDKDKPSDVPTPLEAVVGRARGYLQLMAKGLDYYGNRYDSCPHLSMAMYRDAADRGIANAQRIEDAYSFILNQENAIDAKKGAFEKSLDHFHQQIADLEAQVVARAGDISKAAVHANEMLTQLENLQLKLAEDGVHCVNAIIHKLEGFSWTKFVGMIVSIIDLGDIRNDISTFMNLLHTVKDLPADMKKWQSFIDDIKVIDQDIHDIDSISKHIIDHYNEVFNEMHTIADLDKHKMALTTDKVDKFLRKYMDLPACAEYDDDFHQLANLAATRNAIVMQHDRKVLESAKDANDIAYVKSQVIEAKDHLLEKFDPSTLSTLGFLKRIYQSAKDTVAKNVYTYRQSMTCAALSPMSMPLYTDDVATLSYAHNLVSDHVEEVMQHRAFSVAHFAIGTSAKEYVKRSPLSIGGLTGYDTDDSSNLPPSSSMNDIVYTEKSSPAMFESMRHAGKFNMTLVPSHPAFRGMANVRMHQCKICLVGAKSSTGEMRMYVSHPGATVNIDRTGRVWRFTHDPTMEMHVIDSNGCVVLDFKASTSAFAFELGDANLGNVDQQLSVRRADSPFTTFDITIPPHMNLGLDLAQVHRIEVHMTGDYVPLENYMVQMPWVMGNRYWDVLPDEPLVTTLEDGSEHTLQYPVLPKMSERGFVRSAGVGVVTSPVCRMSEEVCHLNSLTPGITHQETPDSFSRVWAISLAALGCAGLTTTIVVMVRWRARRVERRRRAAHRDGVFNGYHDSEEEDVDPDAGTPLVAGNGSML